MFFTPAASFPLSTPGPDPDPISPLPVVAKAPPKADASASEPEEPMTGAGAEVLTSRGAMMLGCIEEELIDYLLGVLVADLSSLALDG